MSITCMVISLANDASNDRDDGLSSLRDRRATILIKAICTPPVPHTDARRRARSLSTRVCMCSTTNTQQILIRQHTRTLRSPVVLADQCKPSADILLSALSAVCWFGTRSTPCWNECAVAMVGVCRVCLCGAASCVLFSFVRCVRVSAPDRIHMRDAAACIML